MSGLSGGSGLKAGNSGGGGNSGFDIAAIQQAIGQAIGEIQARYHQLGIGVPSGGFGSGPSGAAAQAAASGQSLQYGSPSTMEQMDVGGLQQIAQGALGQLQNQNQSNPAIPGTPANTLQNINQQGAGGFGAGFNSPTTGSPAGTGTGAGGQ